MARQRHGSVKLAALQCALPGPREHNVQRVEKAIIEAAKNGAHVILPSELFEGPYFCQTELADYFDEARSVEANKTLESVQKICKEYKVVVPFSFFEKAGQVFYNSVAMVDADGALMGVYRKSHIPDGPGYEEKFYFKPGDTGFKVWNTRYGCLGVGICWDQWFPECARAMALQGADILLYPTAIGTEPVETELDTREPWQRVMIGHAVANAVAVVAANRVGEEGEQIFYGSSFICDQRGDKLAELSTDQEGIAYAEVNLEAIRRYRNSFGFFRDRRPDLYRSLIE